MSELKVRAALGQSAAAAANAEPELERLLSLVNDGSIAFNRSIHQLFAWCTADDLCFRNWVSGVAKGKRVVPDNFNIGRIAFEHNVNANFSEEINFGYVDVGDSHLPSYGPYKVKLRLIAVQRRTTLLERNSYYFCKAHGVITADQMPLGYRATWDYRVDLAAAKLGAEVRAGMTDVDLRRLLIRESDGVLPQDFIEAHIYNPIHLSAIEWVRGPAPDDRSAAMWSFIRDKLEDVGATIEVLP